jgi:undecaprenyl-diphosphatase
MTMDSLTGLIAGLDFWWLTPVAVFFDNELALVGFTLALVLLTERRRDKVAKIGLAVVLAILLSLAVKELVKIERPCTLVPAKVDCPAEYSFPSGHTLFVFTVMLAFLNKPVFPLYFVYAVFIAFTRIYLGVHSFEDVAGSVALAPFAYYASDILWSRIRGNRYAARDKA